MIKEHNYSLQEHSMTKTENCFMLSGITVFCYYHLMSSLLIALKTIVMFFNHYTKKKEKLFPYIYLCNFQKSVQNTQVNVFSISSDYIIVHKGSCLEIAFINLNAIKKPNVNDIHSFFKQIYAFAK